MGEVFGILAHDVGGKEYIALVFPCGLINAILNPSGNCRVGCATNILGHVGLVERVIKACLGQQWVDQLVARHFSDQIVAGGSVIGNRND